MITGQNFTSEIYTQTHLIVHMLQGGSLPLEIKLFFKQMLSKLKRLSHLAFFIIES